MDFHEEQVWREIELPSLEDLALKKYRRQVSFTITQRAEFVLSYPLYISTFFILATRVFSSGCLTRSIIVAHLDSFI